MSDRNDAKGEARTDADLLLHVRDELDKLLSLDRMPGDGQLRSLLGLARDEARHLTRITRNASRDATKN